METILQLDKLYYHFSYSDVSKRIEIKTWKRKGKELKRKIVKGDKVENGEIAFIRI